MPREKGCLALLKRARNFDWFVLCIPQQNDFFCRSVLALVQTVKNTFWPILDCPTSLNGHNKAQKHF
jgi:hypothetical protein